MRASASGASASRTARSQAASSRVVSAPAPARAVPSFARNTRSRVARYTRLGTRWLRGGAHDARRRRSAPHIPQRRLSRHHDHYLPRRRLRQAVHGDEHGALDVARQRHPVAAALPHEPDPLLLLHYPSDEDIVFHLVNAGRHFLAGAVEDRIERLALLAGEVLLGGPVIGLESGDVGPPFQMVAQLVRQRLPRLVTPIERTELGQRGKGAVVERSEE